MKSHLPILSLSAVIGLPVTAQGSLWVDFNSSSDGTIPSTPTEAGYEGYTARNEIVADFVQASYNPDFALTGVAAVTFQPSWPNTTDNRVQQMFDRGSSNDAQWTGTNINLLTDFIGIDTRTSNGGNGDWDGTTGTVTYMNFTLGSLPSGDYTYRSFHHDTENVWSDYQVEISTDGGMNYGAADTGAMTSSSTGGNPVNPNITTSGTPETLSSTYNTAFSADGTNDVVIRYSVLSDSAVHRRIFGVNGFQLEQVPEPSSALLALLGAGFLARRRR